MADFAMVAHAAPSQLPPLRIERDLMQRVAPQSDSVVATNLTQRADAPNPSPVNRLVAMVVALAACLLAVAAWIVWQDRLAGNPSRGAIDYHAALQRRIQQADESEPFAEIPRLEFTYVRTPEPRQPVSGYIAIDDVSRQWHFYAFDLPPIASDRKYQLWFVIEGNRFVSAGLIDADEKGNARRLLDLPSAIASVTGIAISDEPTDGSEQPTGETFIRADLPPQ